MMHSASTSSAILPRRNGSAVARRLAIPALLATLVIVLVVLATQISLPTTNIPYDPDSPAFEGYKALRLWFSEQGYPVARTDGEQFSLPAESHLLIVPPGIHEWTQPEAEQVAAFVSGGGTLAVIHPADPVLATVLNLAEQVYTGGSALQQAQPVLPGRAERWSASYPTNVLAPDRESSAVPVLVTNAGEPSLLVTMLGNGWVWEMSSQHPLSNGTLSQPEQVTVATALLRGVPPGGTVVFDTYHLFGPQAADAVRSLQDWLYKTAPGRALAYALLVAAFYLLLQGRRLGPPIPDQPERRRREAGEYVRAVAGLKRRAGAVQETATHQRRRLKAAVARQCGLPPGSAAEGDTEFVRLLRHTQALNPETIEQIERLLASIAADCTEESLIRFTSEVDHMIASQQQIPGTPQPL